MPISDTQPYQSGPHQSVKKGLKDTAPKSVKASPSDTGFLPGKITPLNWVGDTQETSLDVRASLCNCSDVAFTMNKNSSCFGFKAKIQGYFNIAFSVFDNTYFLLRKN